MESSAKYTKDNSLVGLPQFHAILGIAERFFGTSILDKSRKKEYINARMILYKILHDIGYKKIEIAKYTNKDHSTVINALSNFNAYVSYDEQLLFDYYELKDRIKDAISNDSPLAFTPKRLIIDKVLTLEKKLNEALTELSKTKAMLSQYEKYKRVIKTIERQSPDEEKLLHLTQKINHILNQ